MLAKPVKLDQLTTLLAKIKDYLTDNYTPLSNRVVAYRPNIDCNTVLDGLHLGGNGGAHYPIVGSNIFWYVDTFFYSSSATAGKQIAYGYNGSYKDLLFTRNKIAGVWYPWIGNYALDDIVITSESVSPGWRLGGTWELIDKDLEDVVNNTAYTLDSATSASLDIRVTKNILTIMGYAAIPGSTDTAMDMLTIDYGSLGITGTTPAGRDVAYSDGANGIAYLILSGTGALQLLDVMVRGSANASMAANNIMFAFSIPIPYANRNDADCNKFYWRRTA